MCQENGCESNSTTQFLKHAVPTTVNTTGDTETNLWGWAEARLNTNEPFIGFDNSKGLTGI